MARMEIDKAIELLSVADPFWISRQRCLAWQAILAYINEAGQPAHNIKKLPTFEEFEVWTRSNEWYNLRKVHAFLTGN